MVAAKYTLLRIYFSGTATSQNIDCSSICVANLDVGSQWLSVSVRRKKLGGCVKDPGKVTPMWRFIRPVLGLVEYFQLPLMLGQTALREGQ